MPVILCDHCRKRFAKKQSQILRSEKHFCSSKCQHDARLVGVMIACHMCGKEVYKSRKSVRISLYKKFFCGRVCSNKWLGEKHSRANHPNWTTGEFSYKAVMKRVSVQPRCLMCEKTDPRILAVHHIDTNRKNSDLSNLAWVCHNCHFLVHHYLDEKARFFKQITDASH